MELIYRIEVGEFKTNKCHISDKVSFVTHGFIYKGETPYGVYYGAWSLDEKPLNIDMLISLGAWDDDSTINDRVAFALKVFVESEFLEFSLVDSEDSIWSNDQAMARIFTRDEAIESSFKDEVFQILEIVTMKDENIKKFVDFVDL